MHRKGWTESKSTINHAASGPCAGRRVAGTAGLALLPVWLLLGGCRALGPSLPPVNLQEPGWIVHQGQAVWHLPNSTREIAGELVVAIRSNGQSLVQFSKTPFPLVVAQQTTNRWEAAFPPRNKQYSARSQPPRRIIWLYLPRMLDGQKPPPNWSWHRDGNNWRLENHGNGESVTGFFTQ
jgi:hypothetical protein